MPPAAHREHPPAGHPEPRGEDLALAPLGLAVLQLERRRAREPVEKVVGVVVVNRGAARRPGWSMRRGQNWTLTSRLAKNVGASLPDHTARHVPEAGADRWAVK